MTYQSWPRTRATLLRMEDFIRLQQPPHSPFTSQCPPQEPFYFNAFHNEDGYVATELTGLWLKGPYLHTGSVPTLVDLLKPAAQRPTHFYRGCDLVDTKGGGFHCEHNEPGAWYYDTAAKGNSNAGHAIGSDLGSLEKAAQLLACLKTL